ncbi:MAG: hypothetical protein ACNA71_10380, partial [Kiritimatiellia bacterium]
MATGFFRITQHDRPKTITPRIIWVRDSDLIPPTSGLFFDDADGVVDHGGFDAVELDRIVVA